MRSAENIEMLETCLDLLDDFLDVPAKDVPTDPAQNTAFGYRHRLIEKTQHVVPTMRKLASRLYTPITGHFPHLKHAVHPAAWDFSVAVACVAAANFGLAIREPLIAGEVSAPLEEQLHSWDTNSWDAMRRCLSFLTDTMTHLPKANDPSHFNEQVAGVLGLYVLRDLYRRPTTDEEEEPTGPIGRAIAAQIHWWH